MPNGGVAGGVFAAVTAIGVVQSIANVVEKAELDVEQKTYGAQAAGAVAKEAGGWAAALAVGGPAAEAGLVCGPAAEICVPLFGLVGGGFGYFCGSSFVDNILNAAK